MARGRPGPVEIAAIAYAARNDGDLGGLAEATARLLVRNGLAERHPRRASFLGRSGSAGHTALYQCRRLTEAGFREAGVPYRTGEVRFVFRNEDAFPGRSVALMCRGGGLRIAVAALEPARYVFKSLPVGIRPPGLPATEIREYDDLPAALDALDRLGAWAERHTGAAGMLVDPAFLAWDGPVLRLEDMGEDGQTFAPRPYGEVVEAMRDAVPGDSFRP